ncbi:MAG: O-antigen ligase family protein [Nitrospirota bacterium]
MRTQEDTINIRLIYIILPLIVIVAAVSFLTTQNYLYVVVPGLAILALFLLGRFPEIGYYAIVFMIPFGAFRGAAPWVIAFALTALTLFQFLLNKRITDRLKSSLWIWFFVLYAVSAFSAVISAYPETAYHELNLLASAYIFIALNLVYLSYKSFSKTLPAVLIISISIGAFLGTIAHYFEIPFLAHTIGTGVDPRAVGAATDPNNFSLMLIFSMPLLVHWFFSAKRPAEKLFVVLVVFMNIYGIVLTYSRGGAIVFLITLLFILFEHRKRFKTKYLGLLLASVSISALMVIALVPADYWERQKTMTHTKTDTAVGRRLSYIVVAWDTFKKNPIIGTGPGTYKNVFAESGYARHFALETELEKGPVGLQRRAHNTYIEHLIGTGIIGFLVFLIIIWIALRNFRKALDNCKKSGREDIVSIITAYRLSFISVLFYLLVFSDVYHKYLLVSLALSQVAIRLSKEDPSKETGE